jgi:hypothetical protein
MPANFQLFKVNNVQNTSTDSNQLFQKYPITASDVKYSNATVISDDVSKWNTGNSYSSSITYDSAGNLHVVWMDETDGEWGNDFEIMYTNYTSTMGWSKATIISDDNTKWNTGESWNPSIAIDNMGTIHVVWEDNTPNIKWGNDYEIMYTNYTSATGWSNATVISDDQTKWNIGISSLPSIAVDNGGSIYVVWVDNTPGQWGSDFEIMCTNYTAAIGWSNASVISDDNTNWNTGDSRNPSIAIDKSGNVHVVWEDYTLGDGEIMYANYTSVVGWSEAIIISDDITHWNNGHSRNPSIAIDSMDFLHVVWDDDTNGIWGNDVEIMYAKYMESTGWSNVTVISDDYTKWNSHRSNSPSIAIGHDNILHVVWSDDTDGIWGDDEDILYVFYTMETGWSNMTVISDDTSKWNNENSRHPQITVKGDGTPHVVWEDYTVGIWGDDEEIMYSSISFPKPPVIDGDDDDDNDKATEKEQAIPFSNFYIIFLFIGIAIVIVKLKRKLNL